MIEDFLQRKLAGLLDSFIEFQKLKFTTADGMTIQNSTIKPKLAELLSEVLQMPLEFISGSISSLTLNKPWQKLFLFMNSPIKIITEGIRLRTKLKSSFSEDFNLKKKRHIIESLTANLTNPMQTSKSSTSFVNQKLKEYFLSTIVLEAKNVYLQIQIDLKHRVELILKLDSLFFRKEDKKSSEGESIHLEIQGVGVYYRSVGNKQIDLISPTRVDFKRVKTEGGSQNNRVSKNSLSVEKLHLNVNNINYGDIARVILLVQWQNSFLNIPYSLWKIKPSVLGEIKPFNKFLYCAHLVLLSIAQQRIQKQLVQRRIYMKIYNKILSEPTNNELTDKNTLFQMQKQMPLWKITAYRSFCINIMKKKVEERIKKLQEKQRALMEEKKKGIDASSELPKTNDEKTDSSKKEENPTSVNVNQIQLVKKSNTSWFRNWLGSQKNPEQLQMQFLSKLDAIELVPSDIESIFNFKVEEIQIQVSIVTSNFGGEPFFSLIGIHCEYNASRLLKDKKWKKDITFRKCKIEYQRYLGNHQRYKNLLGQSKSSLSSQVEQQEEFDEFEEINYVLEVHFTNESKIIEINVLPFDIFINYEIVEKLAIIMNIDWLGKIDKVDRLEKAFIINYDPWLIVDDQKRGLFSNKLLKDKESIDSLKKREIFKLQLPNSLNQNGQKNKKRQAERKNKRNIPQIQIKTAVKIIIPMNLRSYPTPQLLIQIGEIVINIKDLHKRFELKGIQAKGYFMPKQIGGEQQGGLKDMYNYYMSNIEQKVLIRKFNAMINHETHENFDRQIIDISPVSIEIPQRDHMLTLIQLIALHVPKSKESRAKQYHRRKQSIGEEFMDACENLNEQIAKSMIMSSQKGLKRTIVRQKRTRFIEMSFQGIGIESKNISCKLNACDLKISQMGYDQKQFQSNNPKNMNITVYNIKQMMEDFSAYKLHIKKQLGKRGFASDQQKIAKIHEIEINNTNIQLLVFLKKLKRKEPPSFCLQLQNISHVEQREQSCRSITGIVKLSYDQQVDNGKKRSIPLIQAFRISYIQTIKFNLRQKAISVNSLNFNIKPSLLKMLADLIKDYNLQEQTGCTLTNGTINSIKIKSNLNYNKELKNNHKCIINSYGCDLILFNNKLQLQFNDHKEDVPKQKTQCFQISQNNLLINREISPNNYLLQSNIRIQNHQDKAIWIKITEISSVILPEEYDTSRIRLNELSLTPKRQFDVDLTQKISINDLQLSLNQDKHRSRKRISNGLKESKNFSIPLKAKQKINILIDEEDHKYFQIYDQGSIFTEIRIGQLFEETEILLKNQESDQNQYLVIRSQITSSEGVEGSIYTFHIFSPIYIVNKTPWTLEYRLSDDQIQWIEGQQKRRRSFQMMPLKKISSLSAQKIRNRHFNEIQAIKLGLNKHERDITNLSSLIGKIKDKKLKIEGEFYKESQLITLRSHRTQIQIVLRLEFSKNILKIKLYPQYIFINLTKLQIKFKIKQEQITYPQMLLQPLQIEEKQQQSKQQKERRHNRKAYIKQFINQSDEKLKERDVMKQLFDHYEDVIEVFTGSLQENIKKKMLYESGLSINSSASQKGKGSVPAKNRGYMSDYGSEAEMKESYNCPFERTLQQEHLMIYGMEQYKIYKRTLQVQKYFSLVMIIPTVHIINKSTATFYAKSSCERLVTISKESHNYILTNEDTIDLQGCLQEQDISLSDWISVKLKCFGTIYYSKDMIQRHGSGYESKQYALRKKRMKKIPRIFYRVLLCKFEKGQKILIEESKYPPISFINNTKHQIRIEEAHQHFVEQLHQRGNMGQYTPKNPYHQAYFKLSIAEHYQYRTILEFGVEQKKTFNLQKQIVLAVEEYKDKIIVNIKDKEYVNIAASYIDRSQNLQKNDILLEQMLKYSVQIDKICFSVMNAWNKEINSTVLQKSSLVFENKNNKDYYRFYIQNIEGYDYMGTQPDYIFTRNKKEKAGLSILQRQPLPLQNFVNFELIMNRHKSALIIQKCECQLTQSIFYLSAELIIAYIKNYYRPSVSLKTVAKYYLNRKNKQNKQNKQNNKLHYLHKTLIIQSLNWHGTALKVRTRNLTIMQTFLNRNYEKWIVKFINWLGDMKPINFSPLQLYYEQITLMRLAKQIDLNKKLTEVGAVLMDYPLSQLKQVFSTLIGDQQRSIKDKVYTFYKIIKSLEYIVTFTLSINQNLKNQLKTYTQVFIEENKNNPNIINKIIEFQFCEWKYENKLPLLKLSKKIKRLQRYNSRNQILVFDQFKARIKLALDSFINNKLFRPINEVHSINIDCILARVEDWIIVVNMKKNEWTIIRLQNFMMFNLTHEDLILTYLQDAGQKDKYHMNQQNKGSRFKQIVFNGATISKAAIQILKAQIRDNSLY